MMLWVVSAADGEYFVFGGSARDDFEEVNLAPVVDELVRRVTLLPAGVQIRPDNRGVTGIPSYFWVEGYGDAPLEQTESAFGLTVKVSARLAGVEWDFGDGTRHVSAGLGEAWPERSTVSHNYREPSRERTVQDHRRARVPAELHGRRRRRRSARPDRHPGRAGVRRARGAGHRPQRMTPWRP